ncbi:hypothetical protein [Fulvivirga sediminis]|uniref:Uncharacterized protein n=1 Tax=Fulvivirga sediminis TaxID=2803949 RepID=A0A937K1A8_9BACT|nr:hypothetical protein [Fulvivirga sediminis]MBL3658419.1 hypothetical protein [Fulvivirga sediminis]
MKHSALNDQPLQVFLVMAETLNGWKDPASEEGKRVLLEQCDRGNEFKAQGKLLLAGPTDFELTSEHKINPIGYITGVIMLQVDK